MKHVTLYRSIISVLIVLTFCFALFVSAYALDMASWDFSDANPPYTGIESGASQTGYPFSYVYVTGAVDNQQLNITSFTGGVSNSKLTSNLTIRYSQHATKLDYYVALAETVHLHADYVYHFDFYLLVNQQRTGTFLPTTAVISFGSAYDPCPPNQSVAFTSDSRVHVSFDYKATGDYDFSGFGISVTPTDLNSNYCQLQLWNSFKIIQTSPEQQILNKIDSGFTQIGNKIDNQTSVIGGKIDSATSGITNKLDSTTSRLDRDIKDTASQLSNDIKNTASRLDKDIKDTASKLDSTIRGDGMSSMGTIDNQDAFQDMVDEDERINDEIDSVIGTDTLTHDITERMSDIEFDENYTNAFAKIAFVFDLIIYEWDLTLPITFVLTFGLALFVIGRKLR